MQDTQKKKRILETVRDAGLPVGASYLSQRLNLAPATIGRILTGLEEEKMVTKVSNKGRILTEKGEQYLRQEDLLEEKKQTAGELAAIARESDKSTLLEILQVRRLLEVYAAEQASINATEEEIAQLENLMLEHLHRVRKGELGSEVDFEIHLTIARASGVKTIYQILKLILTKDNAYSKFSYVSDKLKNTQIKQHDSIIQAIRERDAKGAGEAMEAHLLQIISDVETYYQEL